MRRSSPRLTGCQCPGGNEEKTICILQSMYSVFLLETRIHSPSFGETNDDDEDQLNHGRVGRSNSERVDMIPFPFIVSYLSS